MVELKLELRFKINHDNGNDQLKIPMFNYKNWFNQGRQLKLTVKNLVFNREKLMFNRKKLIINHDNSWCSTEKSGV